MRVLCVAEKPSAAKKVAEILSQSQYTIRPTGDPHVKNYDFTYNLNNTPTAFVMTALKGHLLELEFEGGINRNWNDYDVQDLFFTPTIKKVSDYMRPIADNIKAEVRRSDVLFIWTDCDREGEAIGGDLMDLCRSVKPDLIIWRAHFSSMQPSAVHTAAQRHVELDMKQVEAVRARSELDLRIGAAFTRLQTMQLRNYFTQTDRKKVLSYGGCQFPTLGFVVDRHQQVENFISEEFWKITMTNVQQREQPNETPLKTTFNWRRNHVFDQWACFIFYEICYEKRIATVTKVKSKQTSKWKPLPLTTVEMQKVACRVLGLSGAHIMQIAEELYTAGLISYPRTETDQFEQGFDFMTLINHQTQDRSWGEYAQILRDGEFERPRNGRNNDKAHPPIHPTAYDVTLSGDKKRVYEFIARRFLGCCWKNAIGHETSVEVTMGTEFFDAKGLVILERNYLEVYTYDKWSGNEIPEFREGDEFVPDTLIMESGHTTAPKLLTESDLIGLMEKNEIGTDATIAEHIQKVLDREYIYKEGQYFKPLTLGIALVLGYDQIGLEASLSKPFLRRQMEADLKSICQGTISPSAVRSRSIHKYEEMFTRLKIDFSKIKQSMDAHFREREDASHISRNGGGGGSGGLFGGSGGHGRGNGGGDSGGPGRGNGGGRGGRGSSNRRGSGGESGGGSTRGNSTRGSSTRGISTRGNSSRGNSSRGGRGGTAGRGSSTAPPRNSYDPRNTRNCKHGKPMVVRTVNKPGANKGREFYICGDNNQCGSFEWADELPSTTNTYNNNNNNNNNFNSSNHNNNTNFNNNRSDETPFCRCNKNSVEKTVTRETPNKGRKFYTCAAGQDSGCDFFEWADSN